MANSRQYTDEELIQRVWDVEEIKKLIHKRVIYIANEMRKEELNDLWVQDPNHQKTASFGRNTGYYTGMDAIRDYYVVHHQKEREEQLKQLHACEENADYDAFVAALTAIAEHMCGSLSTFNVAEVISRFFFLNRASL